MCLEMRKLLNRIINKLLYFKRYEILAKLINDNNFKTYIEVGVWEGETPRYLIKNTELDKLILVDSYSKDSEMSNYGDVIQAQDKVIDLMTANTKKVVPFFTSSESASKLIKDNSIDIIFLDADHAYESVKQDIELWYPKLKKDGILAIHDYQIKYFGVIKAVTERFDFVNVEEDSFCWIRK